MLESFRRCPILFRILQCCRWNQGQDIIPPGKKPILYRMAWLLSVLNISLVSATLPTQVNLFVVRQPKADNLGLKEYPIFGNNLPTQFIASFYFPKSQLNRTFVRLNQYSWLMHHNLGDRVCQKADHESGIDFPY